MTRTFDFVGLNTVISEAFKPLHQVTPGAAHKAGVEAGTHGTTPSNCHFSYFSSDELEKEWYIGYRLGRENREELAV